MADGLSSVLGAAEEHSVGSLGSAECELIKGKAFATSLGDTGSGTSSELQGADRELRDLEETSVIRDGSDNNGGLTILSLHESIQPGDRQRGFVDAGHAQALLDATSEFRVGSSGKKAVQFN